MSACRARHYEDHILSNKFAEFCRVERVAEDLERGEELELALIEVVELLDVGLYDDMPPRLRSLVQSAAAKYGVCS